MRTSKPDRVSRDALNYAAIRTTTRLTDLGTVLPQLWPEVHGWLAAQGVQQAGAPFIHYHAMADTCDLSIGIPTASLARGDDWVTTGTFPAGDYVRAVLSGPFDGLTQAHEVLHGWAADQHLSLCSPTEFYLTDPGQEPDPSKWQTEIVYPIE